VKHRQQRYKKNRKRLRRRAEGWRKMEKLRAERDAEWREDLGGAGGRPAPTQEVNHSTEIKGFSNESTR
jgi:hypothetical protein